MRLLPGMVMLMLALVISGSARATTDVMPFKDEAQEQQFRQLTEQLRCRMGGKHSFRPARGKLLLYSG